MNILWPTLLVLINTLWLMLVLFGLPGNWLMLISTVLFAWWRIDDGIISVHLLFVIFFLAVLAEGIEFFAGLAGARKAGASWRASIAAVIGAVTGAVLGTFLMPIIGTLIGACAGACILVWLFELTISKKNNMDTVLRSGFGAGIGVLVGTTTKFVIGIIIWFIIAVAAYWP
jgi:hypothetical protein